MTKDTERALAAITPLAEALNIKVKADDKKLYCNNQAIGIACNSTMATIDEFIGYLIVNEWLKNRKYQLNKGQTKSDLEQAVKRYWITQKESFGEEVEVNAE